MAKGAAEAVKLFLRQRLKWSAEEAADFIGALDFDQLDLPELLVALEEEFSGDDEPPPAANARLAR